MPHICMEDIMDLDLAMATPTPPMDIPIMERGLLMLNLKPLLRPRLMPHICMEDITDMDLAMATLMLPMDIPIMEKGLLMLNLKPLLRPRLMPHIFMEDIMDILMLTGVTLDTQGMFMESKSVTSF